MEIWLLILGIFNALGWAREIYHNKILKDCQNSYAVYVARLEKDRDDWQRLAQGPRRIEGDEWKDG